METKNSKALTIVGWVLSVLGILFLLMDGVVKMIPNMPDLQDITMKLGYTDGAMWGIAVVIIVCTVLYAIPQTALLGAVLLTGHLGGAIATQVRVSAPEFNKGFGGEPFNIIFPLIIAGFVWGGIYLRDARLRSLLPVK